MLLLRQIWNHVVPTGRRAAMGGLVVWATTVGGLAVGPSPANAGPKSKERAQPVEDASRWAAVDLKEMLSRAQENHPSIRAAEAHLASARARLELARLEVAKEVIQTRKAWRAAKAAVTTAKAELEAADRAEGLLGSSPQRELVKVATERLKIARDHLTTVEVQLEQLVGNQAVGVKKTVPSAEREKVLLKLRAIARQMVEVATAEWRSGKADTSELFTSTRRLAHVDVALAKTKANKLAAIDAYVKSLNGLQKVAEQLYRTGKASQTSVLSFRYAVTEAELWKLDMK